MLEFDGIAYYIDLDALDKKITNKTGNKGDYYLEKETKTTTSMPNDGTLIPTVVVEEFERQVPQTKEVDVVRYDILKYLIEAVIEYEGLDDDSMGADRALNKAELGYKIIFNTLLKEEIIKEIEN